MRNQKGITLVSLVITIIVMLILAGVSISMVVGQNGVLTNASSAVIKQNVAAVREDVITALTSTEVIYQARWGSNTSTTRAEIYDTEGTFKKELENKYGTTNVTVTGTLIGTSSVTVEVTKGSEKYKFTITNGVNSATGAYELSNTVDYTTAKGTESITL